MGTETTNYNLYKPTKDEIDWDDEVNSNFDTIDSELKKKELKVNTVKVDNANLKDGDIKFSVNGSEITASLNATITDDIAKGVTAESWGDHADAGYLSSVSTDKTLSGNGSGTPLTINQVFGLIVDGGETAIETGAKPSSRIMVKSGTITAWHLNSHISTTTTVDVYKNGSKVSGTGSPSISADTKASGTDLSGWTDTSFATGDLFTMNVTANNNATHLTLTMESI
jgi:hypothetical protein